jgi:hypothetical protein
MVVMFAALISMVFFGSWQSMGPKVRAWFGSTGEREVVGSIAGNKVRMGEVRELIENLRIAGESSRWMAMVLSQKATEPQARMVLYRNTIGATAWPIVAQSMSGEKPSLLTALTWQALYREARAAGFDTSEAEVEMRLKLLEQVGLSPQIRDRLISQLAQGKPDKFRQALRVDMTLRAYIEWLSEVCSGAVSPELRREFIKSDDRVKVRLAVVKADDFLAEVKDIPEAALQEQFNKYKKDLPGKGAEGYGYRIPDRVQIEYLEADPKAYEDAVRSRVTDALIEAYYIERKDPEFLIPDATSKSSEKPAAETPKAAAAAPAKAAPKDKAPAGPKGAPGEKGPLTAPVKAAPAPAPAAAPAAPAAKFEAPMGAKAESPLPPAMPEKKYRPLAEVKEQIRQKLIGEEAEVAAREAMHAVIAEIRPLKKAPDLRIYADGKKIKFVSLPGFYSEKQLAELPGIGKSVRGQDRFAAVAVSISDFVGAKAKLGVMEISDPFTGTDGTAYAVRVIAGQANHEPASPAEVGKDVLADVRREKAFEIAKAAAEKLSAAAAKGTLEAAAKDAHVKTVESDWFAAERPISFQGRFFTIPASLPEVGTNPVAVSECFKMAAENKKISLVTLAAEKMAVVIELVGHKGPREAGYELMRPMLAEQVGVAVGGACLKQTIDLKAIQARMAVKLDVADEFRPVRSVREEDSGGDDF